MSNIYRDMLLEHLADAERRCALGARHVERQTLFVTRLQGNGQDASWSNRVLDNFRRAQARVVIERDRLLALLADR